jgi:competence protein ComEC
MLAALTRLQNASFAERSSPTAFLPSNAPSVLDCLASTNGVSSASDFLKRALFWTMPWGIAGVIVMPFGFDGYCWYLMGLGIDWMVAVALWVASLPGAVGRMAAFGIGPLLLGSAGLVVLCLLKSPLRLAGVALLAVASLWAVRTPQPDVLIGADGLTFAVRGADGRLAIVRSGSDTFAARQWLAADADARAHTDQGLSTGIRCDQAGCIGRTS